MTRWVKCVSTKRGRGSFSRVHFMGYSLGASQAQKTGRGMIAPPLFPDQRMKFVKILGWGAGASARPFSRIFRSHAMFWPNTCMICTPSAS